MTNIGLAMPPSWAVLRQACLGALLVSGLAAFVSGCEKTATPAEVQSPELPRPSVLGGPPVNHAIRSAGPPRMAGALGRPAAVGAVAASKGPLVGTALHLEGPPPPANTGTHSPVSTGARFSFSFSQSGAATPSVLWDNTDTGEHGVWLMNGATVTGWVSFGILPVEWRIVAAADFTGDGNPDILWEDTVTGVRGIWVMNGLTVTGWISFGGVPTNWHIVGAADFTGDGQTDVLWQDLSTGVVGIWRMTGTTINGWTSFGGVPTEWHAVGTGHFSGNATPDVMWEDVSTGLRGIWLMNTTTVTGWTPFGGVPTNWHIAGAGQFLSENPADNVLWTDESTGVAGIWRMSGTNVTGWVAMGAVPTQWQPRGVLPAPQAVADVNTQALKAGGLHNCGLTSGGVPYCWGRDDFGQLGNNDNPVSVNAPVMVSGGQVFTALAPGEDHSCGLTSGGAVYCWGEPGAFGDALNGSPRLTPTVITGGPAFASLAAGHIHTCGLTSAGAAYCWGYNEFGSLGIGTKTAQATPTPVSGGLTFASIAAGGWLTCGLTTTGDAYCWGADPVGAIGDGSSDTTSRLVPTKVTGGLKFTSLITGGLQTCGLTNLGDAYCWGQDAEGELGDGTPTGSRPSPTPVSGGLKFATLTAGNSHTCGLTSAGVAYCWGNNDFGQIGDATSGTDRPTPVLVSGGLRFGTLVAGLYHTCGLTFSGVAYCWGNHSYGQVGDGTASDAVDRTSPTPVSGGLLFKNP